MEKKYERIKGQNANSKINQNKLANDTKILKIKIQSLQQEKIELLRTIEMLKKSASKVRPSDRNVLNSGDKLKVVTKRIGSGNERVSTKL